MGVSIFLREWMSLNIAKVIATTFGKFDGPKCSSDKKVYVPQKLTEKVRTR